MKKWLLSIFMLMLALCLTMSASAGSLFPNLNTFAVTELPSFGVTVGKEPTIVMTLDDGRIMETYASVKDEDYYAFGERLDEEGYSLLDSEGTSESILLRLGKDNVVIELEYASPKGIMRLTYPAGSVIEQAAREDLFADCVRVEFNKTLTIKNLGRITFNGSDLTSEKFSHKLPHLQFEFFNSSNAKLNFYNYIYTTSGGIDYTYWKNGHRQEASDILQNIKLYYINGDGVYEFAPDAYGRLLEQKYGGDNYFYIYSGETTISSLDTVSLGIRFELSDYVKKSTDGTIAVTFEINDQKYVLYIREDGVSRLPRN